MLEFVVSGVSVTVVQLCCGGSTETAREKV